MLVKTTMRYHFSHNRVVIIKKKTDNNKCWQGCRKIETLLHCWRECKWYSLFGKQFGISSNVKQNQHMIFLAYTTPRIQPRELKTYVYITCTQIFIAEFFIRAKRCKQFKCPSTNEWINRMWQIHIVEYCSVIKTDEILMHSIT